MDNQQLPMWSQQAQSIKQGIYQHYKGDRYKFIAVSRHSETLEEYVVYQALYGTYDVWIRPLSMFCEEITYGGACVPRFTWVASQE